MIGTTHKGVEELIYGPSVPLAQQNKEVRKLLAMKSHPEFAAIQYQEQDGEAQILKFRTPAAQAAHEKKLAMESKANRAFVESTGKLQPVMA